MLFVGFYSVPNLIVIVFNLLYLVFLVEMQESRNFDVFFEVFLGVFLVFGREKKRRDRLGKREILEKCML